MDTPQEENNPNSNSDTSDSIVSHIEALSTKQRKFLKMYGECGVVKYACRSAGIHRSTFYAWRDRDENFKACLPYFTDDANDTLEYAAYQQGVEGVPEPLVSMGQPVYDMKPVLDGNGEQMLDSRGKPVMKRGKLLTVKKYSPQLLITLLKANMPEKYKDKQQLDAHVNHSGSVDNNTLSFSPKDFTDEELQVVKAMLLRKIQRERQ